MTLLHKIMVVEKKTFLLMHNTILQRVKKFLKVKMISLEKIKWEKCQLPLDGCMDGWMDGWMDFQFSFCVYNLCVSKCFSTKIKNFFVLLNL